jgi:hypothetical protein
VDAWISPSVRASVRSSAAGNANGGTAMIQQLKMKCAMFLLAIGYLATKI